MSNAAPAISSKFEVVQVTMKLVIRRRPYGKPSWELFANNVGDRSTLAGSRNDPRNFIKLKDSLLMFGDDFELNIGDTNLTVGEIQRYQLPRITINDLEELQNLLLGAGCELVYEV